jgi:hypothetical protein
LTEIKAFTNEDSTLILGFGSEGVWRWRTGFSPSVSIQDEWEINEIPDEIVLLKNYPNPFNPSTTIAYELSNASQVSLIVFDVLGRKVATLVNNQAQMSGRHSQRFDASRLASGVYIYQLRAGETVKTGKMMLIK